MRKNATDDRTAFDVIEHVLADVLYRHGSDKSGWATRHAKAFKNPNAEERGIIGLMWAIAQYMDDYRERYASPIGEDGYAGEYVRDILSAFIKLLSMDHGSRLDNGTLDRTIRDMASSQDIESDDL